MQDADGISPLFLAVQHQQHESGILVLLNFPTAQGQEVTSWRHADKKGNTILHYAAMNRDGVKCGREIIALGLSINVTNKKGATPVCFLFLFLFPVFFFFFSFSERPPPPSFIDLFLQLHIAAQMGNILGAQSLISLGANVNAADFKGNTPLHYAVMQSKLPRLAQLLIDSGGDLHAQNQKGKSTLQIMSPKVKQYLGL